MGIKFCGLFPNLLLFALHYIQLGRQSSYNFILNIKGPLPFDNLSDGEGERIYSNHKNLLIDIHVIGIQYTPFFIWCHHMISTSAKYFRGKSERS